MKAKDKRKKLDYNFDYETELLIYKSVGRKKLSRKHERVLADKKFVKYSEWSSYVENKYKNVTINSLNNFKRYFKRSLRSAHGINKLSGSMLFPLLVMIFGLLIDRIAKSVLETYWASIVVVLIFVIQFGRDYTEESIRTNFYEDYMEVIDKLIEKKRDKE